MFKLIAFFAILAAALAAPRPDPGLITYSSGIPLAYSSIGTPITYSSNLGYQYGSLQYPSYGYASNYLYRAPLAYTL